MSLAPADGASPSASPPDISIILAADAWQRLVPVLKCLRDMPMTERVEVVVVLPSSETMMAGFECVRVVKVDSLHPLARARAAGIRAARSPLVFIGETHSFPRPGMFAALAAAHADGCTVAVPIFENANPDSGVSWAGFLNGYASWTAGAPAGELHRAPNLNVSYRRSFLIDQREALDGALSAGENVMDRLRSGGHRVRLEPNARIGHANFSLLSPWLHQRFVAGRVIAGTRSRTWSWTRRIAFAIGCPVLPLVLLSRYSRGIARTIARERVGLVVLPLLAVGMVMQAAGEMAGYIAGESRRASDVYDDYEVRQLSFTAGRATAVT